MKESERGNGRNLIDTAIRQLRIEQFAQRHCKDCVLIGPDNETLETQYISTSASLSQTKNVPLSCGPSGDPQLVHRPPG